MGPRSRVSALWTRLLALGGCAILATLLLQSSGCSPTSDGKTATPVPAPTLTVTDDAGRQVSIPASPRRIVSLSASNTEILFALGLQDRVVGVDQYSNYPPAAREKPQVGSFATPDLEKIVALEPDLILGTEIHVKAALPEMERRGLKVLIVTPQDAKAVLDRIRLVGKVTGQEREAETLAGQMQARMAAVESRAEGAKPVRVFYELSPQLYTAGPGSFVNDLIRMAGGTNIAADAGKQWPQLNQESVFIADPEVILLGDHTAGETPEMVAARPGWRQLTAVKNNRVYVAEPDITNRPGPRVVEGLEWMGKVLHPEVGR